MPQTLSDRLAQPDMVGLEDWQAADALNTPSPLFPCRKDIETADVANYLARKQVVHKLRALVKSEIDAVAELGESVAFILDGRWKFICCSDPAVDAAFKAQLAVLVSLGSTITQAQANDINAMADSQLSWAQANSHPPVHHLDVAKVRRG